VVIVASGNQAAQAAKTATTTTPAGQQSTRRTQRRESVSQALDRMRQGSSTPSAVTHPKWGPYAGKPRVWIWAGGVR
jgi:hypothetical protein